MKYKERGEYWCGKKVSSECGRSGTLFRGDMLLGVWSVRGLEDDLGLRRGGWREEPARLWRDRHGSKMRSIVEWTDSGKYGGQGRGHAADSREALQQPACVSTCDSLRQKSWCSYGRFGEERTQANFFPRGARGWCAGCPVYRDACAGEVGRNRDRLWIHRRRFGVRGAFGASWPKLWRPGR